MKALGKTLIFVTGVAVGATATWWYLKGKYEAIAEAEIESVKAAYSAKERKPDQEKDALPSGVTDEKSDLMTFAKRIQEEGYTQYDRTVSKQQKKSVASDAPYIITPEEFGEIAEYTQVTLHYFADGVLADDNDEPVDDIEEIIGDALEHMGEYEDDSIHVRNDTKRCDYEILRDLRPFSEARKNRPPDDLDDDDEEED